MVQWQESAGHGEEGEREEADGDHFTAPLLRGRGPAGHRHAAHPTRGTSPSMLLSEVPVISLPLFLPWVSDSP
jgi:hypothetical protein